MTVSGLRLPRLLAAIAITAVPLAAADIDARIQRVEQGLRPAVAIAGQPQQKWKIGDRLKFHRVPGVSVAVIANGKVEWARGYGAVAGSGKAVDAQTLFQAASISKPVASMVALHLVDEGKLSLDEDVNLKPVPGKFPRTNSPPRRR